jgi:hypothetical protein
VLMALGSLWIRSSIDTSPGQAAQAKCFCHF